MPTISSYETGSGKRYEVRYRTPDRRQTRKRGFRTKRAAQDWAAENTVALNTGGWRPEIAGRVKVASYAEEWLASKQGIAPKTRSNYRDSVNHISKIGSIGQIYLRDVRRRDVERWVAEVRKTHAPKGVRNSFGVLSQVLKRAVDEKRIAANPCDGVELPRVVKKETDPISVEGVEAIAANAGEYGDVVRFLACTELRWGEMAGLEVRDIDLAGRRILVRRQITEDHGNLVRSAPKHNKSRRVPIIGQAAAILTRRVAGKAPSELVFTTGRGAVLRNRNARRDWFDAAVERAGYEGTTPHDLRHTFASVAIASGASIKAIQSALGHHSAAFTLDVYGHMFPDDYSVFIDAMTTRFETNCVQNVSTGTD